MVGVRYSIERIEDKKQEPVQEYPQRFLFHVIPANAGIYLLMRWFWIPASAGMTGFIHPKVSLLSDK
ncbi:hypothetical protein BOW51_03580 [Solemya velesiana gill symbiont]|uniref:Uncharacterized protein n=1 Tax=Solemya velesiana gill symbiont TaxID=1918948 RepID=A0A1T2KWH2_9GAMM|nr:hypothetical protein BOW51_03580 [Solemya velesiana gill symbiont]